MKVNVLLKRRIRKRGDGAEREIEEEIRFHLEMLAQAYSQQKMSTDEAHDAARRRFGDVERVKNECLAIASRRSPFLVALKVFLIVMFASGLALRFFKMDSNVHHLGDVLMAVPTLSGLLLYVRSLDSSRFPSTSQGWPLRLNETIGPVFAAYDEGMRTPVERLISDK